MAPHHTDSVQDNQSMAKQEDSPTPGGLALADGEACLPKTVKINKELVAAVYNRLQHMSVFWLMGFHADCPEHTRV